MFYTFEERVPVIKGDHIFIAESAEVIGSVVIHNHVTVLPNVVIRADNEIIEIGEGTNIQDGAVLHTDPDIPMKIGKGVTVAHNAMLHGCTIGDNTVIAIGAVVKNNANIGNNCIIGAGALVLENQKIPDNSLVVGSPAKVKCQLSEKQTEQMKWYSQHYIDKIDRFNSGLKAITLDQIKE